jgi:hypothetical protein
MRIRNAREPLFDEEEGGLSLAAALSLGGGEVEGAAGAAEGAGFCAGCSAAVSVSPFPVAAGLVGSGGAAGSPGSLGDVAGGLTGGADGGLGAGFGLRGGLGPLGGGNVGNFPPASAKYEFEKTTPQCGHFVHAGLTDPTPSLVLQAEQYHSCGPAGILPKGGLPGCA